MISSGAATSYANGITWVRSAAGDVLALDDNPAEVGGDWVSYGKPSGIAVGSKGIAAVPDSLAFGTTTHHVFYVGADGNLWEGERHSDASVSWTTYAPPTGHPLTGYIAAGIWRDAQHLTEDIVFVAATTTDGKFYRWIRYLDGSPLPQWVDSTAGLVWSTTTPVAASTDVAMSSRTSFFASHIDSGTGNNELAMLRFDPFTQLWTPTDINGPAGFQACGTLAAVEGQLNSVDYRVYLICGATSSSSTLAYARATSATSTTFTWFTETLPASIDASWGNVMSGVKRLQQTAPYYHLDAYLLTTDNHVRRKTYSDTGLLATSDLGLLDEAITARGGFTAAPRPASAVYSRVLFPAVLGDGTSPDATYLFERYGNSVNGSDQYQNYGGSTSSDDVVLGGTRAEGMLAEYKGTVSAALLNRPGGGPSDWPRIHVLRSTDDAESFGSAEVLGIQTGFDYVTDPTVGVTDGRRTYVLQLGQKKTGCDQQATESKVYLMYADNGSASYSTVLVQNSANVILDHPFMDVEHKAGADRLHMAWWNISAATVEYRYRDDGGSLSSLRTIKPNPGGGPPRVAANDLGDVYVAVNASSGNQIQVCKLNSTFTMCMNSDWLPSVTFDNSKITVQGAVNIRGDTGYSIAASPTTSGVVFLCYQRAESDLTHKDIACRRGAFSSGVLTWGNEVRVGPQDDGRDQFFPEVSVTAKTFTTDATVSTEGEVYVAWYDRYNDPVKYRVRAAQSLNAGMSWSTPRLLNATDSDPEYLPRHCTDSNLRFLGDYSAARASSLHTHPLYVTVPAASISTDVKASFRSLGAWRN